MAFVRRHEDGAVLLVTASSDRTIKLWNAESGTCIRTLTGHDDFINCVAFSPDGSALLSGDLSGSVCVWDIATGTCITTVRMGGWVHDVVFSADGRTVCAAFRHAGVLAWRLTEDVPRKPPTIAKVDLPRFMELTEQYRKLNDQGSRPQWPPEPARDMAVPFVTSLSLPAAAYALAERVPTPPPGERKIMRAKRPLART
jgi:hypothetical protein